MWPHVLMARRLLAMLAMLAILTAGCSSTEDETQTETQPEVAPTTAETQPDPVDQTPEQSEPEEEPEAQTEPIVLTASYQGVTETSVRVGVAVIDPAQIFELFGIDLGVFDVQALYDGMAADANAKGGVLGRNVEVTVSSFLPVGSSDSERVCTELIEDTEVFVVIGQFIEDNALCITELHGHPYVGHFGETPERQTRSNGLLFATEMEQTRQRVGGTTEMIRAGDFDGRNVGIYYEADPDEAYANAVQPLLEEAGINVVGIYQAGAGTQDSIADGDATDTVLLRMQADGADMVLNVSGIGRVLQSKQRLGWQELRVAMTNGQAADRLGLAEDLGLEDEYLVDNFAVTTSKPTIEESLADPSVQACIDQYNATPNESPLDLEDPDIVNGVMRHCRAFAMTILIMQAAGGDLTPESFRAGAESLGPVVLPGMPDGELGPNKHSAGSAVRRYEYDLTIRDWLPVGDPIPTEDPVN